MKLETKMRLQSLGVWWAVCFLAFNFIAEIILGTGRDISAMLKTAAVCAVLAVPADLLMYFVILKKTDKEYQNYQKIAAVVAEHGGMCDEARELNKNEQLDAQLRDLPEKCCG